MKSNWTKEQENAINLRNSNILVSASAGSGKTAVLVERIIKRVVEEGLDVDSLLVVTFTKAAAGELKERLQKALKDAIEKDKGNSHLKKQLKNISVASITTIHSFCLDIIRSNFYKLGLDPNFSICDEAKAKLLKMQAINEVIEEEYSMSKDVEFGLYDVLKLFNMDDEEFINCISKIWEDMNCYVNPEEYLKGNIEKYNIQNEDIDLSKLDFGQTILEDTYSNLKIAYNKSLEFMKKFEGKEKEFVKYIELLDLDIFNLKLLLNSSKLSWDELYKAVYSLDIKNMPKSKVDDEALKEEFSNFRKVVIKSEIESVKNNIYNTSKNIIGSLKKMYKYLEYIYSYIIKVSKVYARLKNEENSIDFSDIEHMAADILLEKDESGKVVKTKEAKRYVEKFEEIYIDEYQDTSYIQETILEAVSRNNPGNRFMVGDIKQSIYKFRHAAVDIFIDKYNTYTDELENSKDDKKIILAKNFRSRKQVLCGINYIFEKIMSEEVGNCNYAGKELLTLGNEKYIDGTCSYNFEINILDFKENEEENNESNETDNESLEYIKELKRSEHEAIYIARRIYSLVNDDKMQVMDNSKENPKLRNITYSDICILLRSMKGKSEIYEKALKSLGIPAYSSSNVNLWDNDEVNLVLSFLKVLDSPLQEIEMISIMYSIIGKFTLDEIYTIKSRDFKKNIYDIMIENNFEDESEILREKITNLKNLLNEYMSLVNVLKVSEIISRIYNRTSIYNYTLLLENPTLRKMNLDSLISAAISVNDSFNVSEFIHYIETLKTNMVKSPDTPKIISENEDVVRIMTVHASKGLEFPVVILAGADKKYSLDDFKSKVLTGKYGIGIDFIDEELKITYPTVIKEAIKQKEIKSNKSEELRMLYVALTRAKEKIITYMSVKDLEKKLESMYILKNEDGKIDASISFGMNSFQDVMLLGIKEYMLNEEESKKNIFDINHYYVNSIEGMEIYKDYEQEKSISIPKILSEVYSEYLGKGSPHLENMKNKIKEKIVFEYGYKEELDISRRVGVSTLKKNLSRLDEVEEEKIEMFLPDSENVTSRFKVPKENSKLTSARKGTIVHYILENIDYDKVKDEKSLNEYLLALVKKSDITETEKESVNTYEIIKYLKSELAEKIRNSKYYKKEVEFVLINSAYSKSAIQGVIDLYFETQDGKLYLVDFKTDNIYEEEEFRKRYSMQLLIYKEALEKILKKKVEKTLIYSFKLGKEIEIND